MAGGRVADAGTCSISSMRLDDALQVEEVQRGFAAGPSWALAQPAHRDRQALRLFRQPAFLAWAGRPGRSRRMPAARAGGYCAPAYPAPRLSSERRITARSEDIGFFRRMYSSPVQPAGCLAFRQQQRLALGRGQPVVDHFLQAQRHQRVAHLLFQLQRAVAALGGQHVAQPRGGDALVAVHARHFFHQIGHAQSPSPISSAEGRGFEHTLHRLPPGR
jgi:hypothetical protein